MRIPLSSPYLLEVRIHRVSAGIASGTRDEYTPDMKPTNKAMLKFIISFDPNTNKIITGIMVVNVVNIVLYNVLLIEISTSVSKSFTSVILFLYLFL